MPPFGPIKSSDRKLLFGGVDLARLGVFLSVLAFFFVSGACGLLYQVVWTRKLVLLLGTTSYAVSTVLFIFFLGLGLGSLWGGRLSERTSRPLFVYGLLELLIGLWAVVFILLISQGESIVVTLLRQFAGARSTSIALRGILAIVFLLVPVTLMGATLPLLARFVATTRRAAGLRIGALYTINTLGAAVGCAITGFFFLERFGYIRTTLIGAFANSLIGILAILLQRACTRTAGVQTLTEASNSSGAGDTAPSALMAGLVLVTFAVSGFCALALEVLWTRLLAIVFVGTTYAFTTMLTSLLFGLVVGGAVASLVADRFKNPIFLFGMAETLAGLACVLTLGIFAGVPELYHNWSFEVGSRWEGLVRIRFMVSFLVLFGPTFLFGMTFPFAVKAWAGFQGRLGRDVGILYFANTCGGLLGALAGGFLLIPLLGTHWGILILGVSLYVLGLIVVLAAQPRFYAALLVLLLVLGSFIASRPFVRNDVGLIMTKANLPSTDTLIHYREGVEGAVGVSDEREEDSSHGNRVLWINGVQATASIERGVKMNRFQGVLPLLFDRDPHEALLMCFGSGITCGTLALYPFDRIDAVEISRDVLDAAPLFAQDNLDVIKKLNIRFIVDDGRNFLLTTRNRYDLITFEPMPLALAGVSTFYTREYYELCLDHLSPRGIVSQWVPLHSLNPEVVKSLVHTFTSVFPEYCAWFINADLFVIGSREPLAIDYARAAERITQPAIHSVLSEVGWDDLPELIACFFMGKENLAAFASSGRIMTDDRPWAEFEAPRLMHENTVHESLKELTPYYESPLTLVRLGGLFVDHVSGVGLALDRRFRAKREHLRRLTAFYSSPLASPEDGFLAALRIDPNDRDSLDYLRPIAKLRTEQFVRWKQFDEGEHFLAACAEVVPKEPLFHLLLGDVYFEQGSLDKAAEHYGEYVALGGVEPRAKERIQSVPAKP